MVDEKHIQRVKVISLIIASIILAVFILSLINYRVLNVVIEESFRMQVDRYGYIAISVIAFLVEILPQPIVSALFPFANGLMFGLDFSTLLIFTMTGALLSNFVAWIIGTGLSKRYGPQLVGEENYEKNIRYFRKYGRPGISILALTPLPYFPILTGLFRMKLWEFLVFAILPRTCHFLLFGYLIYYIL